MYTLNVVINGVSKGLSHFLKVLCRDTNSEAEKRKSAMIHLKSSAGLERSYLCGITSAVNNVIYYSSSSHAGAKFYFINEASFKKYTEVTGETREVPRF